MLTAATLLAATAVAASASAAPKLTDSVIGVSGSTSAASAVGGTFSGARGIGVNRDGDGGVPAGTFYVADDNFHRVQAFNADGSFRFAIGKNVVPGEVQAVTVADATDGSFTLTFDDGVDSDTTGPIDHDAAVGDVQEALEGLSNVAVGDVVVSAGAGGASYAIGFKGSFAGDDVDEMTADGTNLVPAVGATVSVDTDLEGDHAAFERCTTALHCKAGENSGGDGTAAGNGTFDNPQDVAVDQDTGNFYVSDRDNRRISRYAVDGTFQRSFGWDVVTDGGGFQVCVAGADICRAGDDGSGAGQYGPGSVASINGIAVTPGDDNPATGRVYLANTQNQRVEVYNLDGTVATPSSIGSTTEFTGSATNRRLRYVAVDANGVLYAPNSTSPYAIHRFDAETGATHPDGPITAPDLTGIGGGNIGVQGLSIDSGTGSLLISHNPSAAGDDTLVREIADPGSASPSLTDVYMTGAGNLTTSAIAADHAGARDKLFVTTGNQLFVLDADGANPAATGQPGGAVDVGAHEATLTGTVNPLNVAVFPTSYFFEYSKTGVDGSWTRVPASAGPFTGGLENVADTVTGLEANTFYRMRLVVERNSVVGSAGRSVSPEQTFSTDIVAPEVETLRFSQRTATGATLVARINPNSLPTAYRFEYVTDGEFAANGWANASSSPVPPASAGSQGQPALCLHAVTGLQPGTTYHYRIVASNGQPADPVGSPDDVDVEGDGRQFTTRSVMTGSGDRVYELVTPPDKPVGNGPGHHSGHDQLEGEQGIQTPVASAAGEQVLMSAGYGATLAPGAASFAVDHALAERDPASGWLTRSAYNRINYSPFQSAPFMTPTAVNESLSLMAWAPTLSGAQFFPKMLDAGFDASPGGSHHQFAYLRDWEGRWELVAPRAPEQGPCCDPASGGSMPPAAVSANGEAGAVSSLSRGVLGDGDPSWDQIGGGFTTYVMDASEGLSDTFPSDTPISLVGSCDPGTTIPEIDDNGTDAGPAGSFSLFGSYTAGNPEIAVEFNFGADPVVGHTVHSGAGLVGSKVTAVAGDGSTFEVDPAPTASAGPFASVSGGQNTAALADDFIATQPCPEPVEYEAGEFRDGSVVSRRGASLGDANDSEGRTASFRNILSEDGSRLFFHAPDGLSAGAPASCGGLGEDTDCPTQLYVRQEAEDGSVATRWLSQTEVDGQGPGLLGPAYFEGASVDGGRVFFTSNSPLTADDRNRQAGAPPAGGHTTGSANVHSWDLYMYELGGGDDPTDGGALTRVSAGPNGDGDCNVVQGSILATGALRFVSDDGTRLYFTCNAPLPGVAGSTNGTITSQGGEANQGGSGGSSVGTTNLYMYENVGGAESWEFVAQLPRETKSTTAGGTTALCASSGSGSGQWRETQLQPGGGVNSNREGKPNCFRGTRDARFVTFETPGRLVESDPDASSSDVYAFDADADELIRVSEPQGGVGGSYTCITQNNQQCYGDGGFQALSSNNPRQLISHLGVVTDPDAPGDRVAFFQSRSRLVAEDTDTTMDVYEWRNGELSLLTEGVETGAFYSGNSADGRDVFFITEDQLAWNDIDPLRDLYDARVDGGDYAGFHQPPPPPPACSVLAGACQPAAAAPATPAETTTAAPRPADTNRNATPTERVRLAAAVAKSRKARRRSARRGMLAVRVRSSGRGRVRVVAVARNGRLKGKRVGRGTRVLRKAGKARIAVRLALPARRWLRSGRPLRLRLRIAQSGARPRRLSVSLARGGRR